MSSTNVPWQNSVNAIDLQSVNTQKLFFSEHQFSLILPWFMNTHNIANIQILIFNGTNDAKNCILQNPIDN